MHEHQRLHFSAHDRPNPPPIAALQFIRSRTREERSDESLRQEEKCARATRAGPASSRVRTTNSFLCYCHLSHVAATETPVAPPPTAPSPQDNAQQAITKVRDMIETIDKREGHVQRKIDNEITNAKKLSAAGKKREALQCIKRKKMYEKQLDQIR